MSSQNDYLKMLGYGNPAEQMPMFSQGTGMGYAMPQMTSAKPGFDWGGATSTGAMDWTKGASSMLGQGGFNGSQVAAPGMFGGMFDGVGAALKDSGFLGSTDAAGNKTDGWGGAALGVANGLMSGYMGMKQYGLSKDIFENNKAQFERNFGAQKGITNASLQDRQERRVREAAANGNSSATNVADYMSKYGVK